jgi:hypothetical protein
VYQPLYAALATVAFIVIGLVWARPVVAAYLIVGVTPLVVGIDRGALIPLLRPNEGLALLVGGALASRGIARWRAGRLPRISVSRVEVTLFALAVTSSIVPLTWMMLRNQPVTGDDLSYALILWKYLGVYAIVRFSVMTQAQVLRCLWISVGAAAIVAAIGILQALDLAGVRGLLSKYYAPYGYVGALANPRGGSTVSLPAAAADLLIFNLAIAVGLWVRYRRRPVALCTVAVLCVFGILAAGEFSSAIGLVLGVLAITLVVGRLRYLRYFPFLLVAAGFLLRPVIATRLQGFQSASGIPDSWAGRLRNLHDFFWPHLFSNYNWVFGVRPAARVPVSSQATGYVWIESGYTWLLWGGGVPLVLAFAYFVYAVTRSAWWTAHHAPAPAAVAGAAVFAALVVMTVLMAFDPHLTYRGAADCLFALFALMSVGSRSAPSGAGLESALSKSSAPAATRPRDFKASPLVTGSPS